VHGLATVSFRDYSLHCEWDRWFQCHWLCVGLVFQWFMMCGIYEIGYDAETDREQELFSGDGMDTGHASQFISTSDAVTTSMLVARQV